MSRGLVWPWRRGGPKRWELHIANLSSLLCSGGSRKLFTVLRIKVSVSSSIFSGIPENFKQSFLEYCSRSSRRSSIFRVLDFKSLVSDTNLSRMLCLRAGLLRIKLAACLTRSSFLDKLSSKSLSSWRSCERFWDTSESEQGLSLLLGCDTNFYVGPRLEPGFLECACV